MSIGSKKWALIIMILFGFLEWAILIGITEVSNKMIMIIILGGFALNFFMWYKIIKESELEDDEKYAT